MTLHPQSEAFIAAIKESQTPTWKEMGPVEARRFFDAMPVFGTGPAMAEVSDRQIAGVPTRLYSPHDEKPGRTLVYFHGGGWVLGNVQTHDALCRRLAAAAKVRVVNVDYRLAPEHPYPAAPEDCFAVCAALAKGDDPAVSAGASASRKIIVAGDSAGGNLAAAVSMMFRDRSAELAGHRLAGQVLLYPVLDAEMNSDSYQKYAEGFGLTRETMHWFWEMYLGRTADASPVDGLASPLAGELTGLPATHIVTAQYDVLCDEGTEMAQRLRAAGVPTTLHQQPGMLHGFLHFAELFDDAAEATQAIARHCCDLFDKAQ